MSLSPIISAASQALSLFGGSTASSGSAPTSSITDSAGNVDLSQAAQLFSKLRDLSQTDSAKFQQLTAQISSQLQAAAQNATGSGQSFLNNLADDFSTASQTGSASSLQPAHGGGHHHHHASSSSPSAQTAYEQTLSAGSQTGIAGVLQNIYQQVESA